MSEHLEGKVKQMEAHIPKDVELVYSGRKELEYILKRGESLLECDMDPHMAVGICLMLGIVKERYDNIPLLDRKTEDRHGSWMRFHPFAGPYHEGCYYYRCSECKKLSEEPHNYCPECGAKMEADKDDQDKG